MENAKRKLPERFAKDGSRGLRMTSSVPVNWGQCEFLELYVKDRLITSIVNDHVETF